MNFQQRHDLSFRVRIMPSMAQLTHERRFAMFWIFMLIAGGAATFAALGMYAVWFKVLSIALLVGGVMILGLTGALLWRRVFLKQ
jgi:hypothetical protein